MISTTFFGSEVRQPRRTWLQALHARGLRFQDVAGGRGGGGAKILLSGRGGGSAENQDRKNKEGSHG